RRARRIGRRVVVRQADELHGRQGAAGLVLVELIQPLGDPGGLVDAGLDQVRDGVGLAQVVAGVVEVGVGRQPRFGAAGHHAAEDAEAVVAVTDAGVGQLVPDEGIRRVGPRRGGQVAALEVIGPVLAAVVLRPGVLHVGVGQGAGGPVPAVGGYLGVGI